MRWMRGGKDLLLLCISLHKVKENSTTNCNEETANPEQTQDCRISTQRDTSMYVMLEPQHQISTTTELQDAKLHRLKMAGFLTGFRGRNFSQVSMICSKCTLRVSSSTVPCIRCNSNRVLFPCYHTNSMWWENWMQLLDGSEKNHTPIVSFKLAHMSTPTHALTSSVNGCIWKSPAGSQLKHTLGIPGGCAIDVCNGLTSSEFSCISVPSRSERNLCRSLHSLGFR